MVWKCSCGTQNELYNLFCSACREEMPKRERNRVYIRELMLQLKECAVIILNSAPVKFVESLLWRLKKNIKEILSGTKKENLKFLAIPVIFYAIIIINIIIQVTGMKIERARIVRQERRAYSIERRADFNENVRLKIDYAIKESGFSKIDTPTNQLVKEHIEGKKTHFAGKLKTAIRFIIQNVERGYEKCRLYFD